MDKSTISMSIFNSFFLCLPERTLYTLSRAALTMRGEEEATRKRKPGAETCDFLYHRFFIMGPLMSTATLFCYDWKIQITMYIYIFVHIRIYEIYHKKICNCSCSDDCLVTKSPNLIFSMRRIGLVPRPAC